AWPLRDPVSSLTHLAAAVFGLFATLLLTRLSHGDRVKQGSLAVFGLSAVLLYAVSGLYHALPLPLSSPAVEFFRRLDHSAIDIPSAGTYPPVFAVLLAGRARTTLLTGTWLVAAAGAAGKWLVPIAADGVTITLYLLMGWLGVLIARPVVRTVGWPGL